MLHDNYITKRVSCQYDGKSQLIYGQTICQERLVASAAEVWS
jgi:hypothetical protein